MRELRLGAVIGALVAALVCVPGALSAPPSNDNFASAAVIVGELGTSDWTNLDASKESGEPNHAGNAGGRSIWFSWVAPRDGSLLIDTCDSAIDTLLAVYTGEAVDQLVLVVGSDDDCGTQSGVELAVVQGEELRIAVDGKNGATGAINLWWGMRPANDDFVDASQLTGWDAEVTGSNVLASHELNEPLHAGEVGYGSLWYRWTAPGSEPVQVNTCGSAFDTVLAVYRGASLGDLEEVSANDDACGTASSVSFAAVAGETYYIAVDGFDAASFGSFALHLLRPAPRGTSRPTISGRPWDGETLTGELGQWVGAPELSFEFWWEGCGAECYTIPGSNGMRTIRAAAMQTLRFVVRATNAYGSATMHSESVTIPVVPTANVSLPAIGGEPLLGKTLRVTDHGTWTGTPPLRFSYQWERCDPRPPLQCLNINTVNASSYTLRTTEVGFLIRVRVVALGHGGFASAHSGALGPVLGPSEPQQRVSCRVPRLTGKTLRAARTSLARAHCRLGQVRRVHSMRKVGRVVGQTPRPGTRLRSGARVKVRVSKGRRR